jgi:TRAP-type uncharacterized transport system fused permease subunit
MMLTWRYTLPAFLVPFVFTLNPEGLGVLLQGPVKDILIASATAAAGVVALAAGTGGWIRRAATVPERITLVAAGLLLFYAARWADIAGLALAAVVLLLHFNRWPPASVTTGNP